MAISEVSSSLLTGDGGANILSIFSVVPTEVTLSGRIIRAETRADEEEHQANRAVLSQQA